MATEKKTNLQRNLFILWFGCFALCCIVMILATALRIQTTEWSQCELFMGYLAWLLAAPMVTVAGFYWSPVRIDVSIGRLRSYIALGASALYLAVTLGSVVWAFVLHGVPNSPGMFRPFIALKSVEGIFVVAPIGYIFGKQSAEARGRDPMRE